MSPELSMWVFTCIKWIAILCFLVVSERFARSEINFGQAISAYLVVCILFAIGVAGVKKQRDMNYHTYIQQTMADFHSYDEVTSADTYATRNIAVTEHQDYKTIRLTCDDGTILEFHLFPDFSYHDVKRVTE